MATLVYGPEAFTVGSNIDLETYDSQWTRLTEGTSVDPSVRAATDDVRNPTTPGTGARSRWNGSISAEQRITGDIIFGAQNSYTGFTVRTVNNSKDDCYLVQWASDLNSIRLYRVVGGSFTTVQSSGGVAVSTTYTGAFAKATTVGATVVIDYGDAINGAFQYTDTDAARHLSGLPGIDIYEANVALNSAIDNISIYEEGAVGIVGRLLAGSRLRGGILKGRLTR